MRQSGHPQRHTDGRPARWGASVVVTLLALLLLGHHDALLFDVAAPAHAASAHAAHDATEAAGPAEHHGHGAHTASSDSAALDTAAADRLPAGHTDPAHGTVDEPDPAPGTAGHADSPHGATGHADCSTSGAVCWSAKSELDLPAPALVPEALLPQPATPAAALVPAALAWTPSPPDLAQLSILRI